MSSAAKKSQIQKQTKEHQSSKVKELGSVLITNLPTDTKSIYTSLIKRLFHSSPLQQQISDIAMISETSAATLSCTVPTKTAAVMMKKRLHNSNICGRKWKMQCVPVSEITCNSTACLVECITIPACDKELIERALSAVPGFLSLVDESELLAENTLNKDNNAPSESESKNLRIEEEEEESKSQQQIEIDSDMLFNVEEENSRNCEVNNVNSHVNVNNNNTCSTSRFLASFVNEGSALHARAVLSGRLIGTSGAHLFLSRRR